MLAADKDRLIANVKQTALQLRQKELEYYVERYSNLATQSSIIAGFAFDGLVELDPSAAGKHEPWCEYMFYAAGACTMAFSMYTLCVASFATVYGHRLALQGPTGSVERAVAVMMRSRNSIFASFALSMLCLMVAATAMAWVKMGYAAAGVTAVFGVLFICLVLKYQEMKHSFRIDPVTMVRGDVRLHVGDGNVDVSQLEAGMADADRVPQRLGSAATTRGSSSSAAAASTISASWGLAAPGRPMCIAPDTSVMPTSQVARGCEPLLLAAAV